MSWIEHRWYGPSELMVAVRDALPLDAAVIGTLVPPRDQPLRVLDGESAISFLATTQMTPPEGVKDDRPQTITALQGLL